MIDEAHCISDWGHDFRLEYGKLKMIIGQLPANVPVLATTATANDRVVADLRSQLGSNVFVSRGSLTRDSLYIQVLNKPGKTERYAWILQNVPRLPGSGITHVCSVPSLRSELVRDFALRVARSLKLEFADLLEKTAAPQQKEMENSAHQCGGGRGPCVIL